MRLPAHRRAWSRRVVVTVVAVAAVATATTAWALHGPASALLGTSSETTCDDTSHETPADAASRISGLTAGTRAALARAQHDAGRAGVTLTVNSGYRSAAYQKRIYDCWVAELGSPQAARQRALPPGESAHVAGYALDIAPQQAADWLEKSAGAYGLCRRYENEAWHFEYQASYAKRGCPALLAHP